MGDEEAQLLRRQAAYWEKVLPLAEGAALDVISGESAVRPPADELPTDQDIRLSRRVLAELIADEQHEDAPDTDALPSKEELVADLAALGIRVHGGVTLCLDDSGDERGDSAAHRSQA